MTLVQDSEVRLHGGPEEEMDVRVSLRPALLYSGRRYPVKPQLSIGSATDAGLRLPPDAAAALHAVVEPGGNELFLTDLSGIGLLINGEGVRGGTRAVSGGDRLTIGGEHLFVVDGTEGAGIPGAQSFSIGSDARSDVHLDHPGVSPLHAIVERRAGGAFVRDHSHGAGLTVDGHVVRAAPLELGAELGVGPFRLVFDGTTLVLPTQVELRMQAVGVTRMIGGRTIVEPTTVAVRTGELVGIIGQSGAGKTTLLKMLAGVDKPDSGAVMLSGEAVEARRTEIGYVPQDEIVHGELTVEEAIWYAASLRVPDDATDDRIAAAVAGILDELDLGEHRKTRIDRLSGGQRRRVSVATELVNQPGVLLLDEPTTGLDPGLERRAMELFGGLADSGRSVVLTTHATKNLRLCDKLLVLASGGRTCFFGTPTDAIAFFEVSDFDEIYAAINGPSGALWHEAFESTPARMKERELLATQLKSPGRCSVSPRRSSFRRQFSTLLSRYGRVFTRDRKNVALLIGQAPLLGLMAALIFPFGALDSADQARNATNLLFLLTTIAVWLGAISGAREIVRERPLMRREAAVGIRTSAYLSSKCVLLGGLAVIQVVMMALAALAIQPPDVSAATLIQTVACLVLAAWTAVTLGLAISAYATTENQATSVIPLTLIPQLLLGGAIVAVANMSVLMKGVAALTFTRWFFAGTGTSFDLNARIADDAAFANVADYGSSFFRLPLPTVVLVAILFGSLQLAFATGLIKARG